MIRMSATFLILAAITMVGACAAMMLRGLVHCALAVAIAFAGLGTLYPNLGAQFLGLAQLLVYVGASAVLMDGYVLPLEVIGLMLTAALIGAVIIAMKENRDTQ